MIDTITAYSKALTALLTSLAMAYIRSRVDLGGLGIEGTALTVVSMSFDGFSALIVGGLTLLIPIGQKWWHQNILGERVAIVTVNPTTGRVQQIEGTVVTVNSTGVTMTPDDKADAIDHESAR